MRAEVLGIGWVTAAGLGRGREPVSFTLPGASIPAVSRKDVFAEPDMRFGRLDEFSRVGLAAIALALQDAGLDAWEAKRPIALIAGTLYGCLPTDSDYFDTVVPQEELPSPQLFAYTLPNCFLGEAAIRFGLTGPAYVVNEPDHAPLLPLRLALETLAWDEAEVAVAGVCDLVRPRVLDSGPDTPGAVFLVLRRAEGGEGKTYGELAFDCDGKLSARGVPVDDLEALVNQLRTSGTQG